MIKIILFTATLIAAITGAAATAKTDILIDGSVGICSEGGDIGRRAFRLSVKSLRNTELTLSTETLICSRVNGRITYVPYALSRVTSFGNAEHTMTYAYPLAYLVILNSEGTTVFQRILLNSKLIQQEITVATNTLQTKTFDVALQSLEVIQINGQPYDQGMEGSGSYRITINK